MFHSSRKWSVSFVDSKEPDVLAEKLTESTWTLCTGFHLSGTPYMLLNDSLSEDGAQEYALLHVTVENNQITKVKELDSITFGWMNQERAAEFIKEILAGKYDDTDYTREANHLAERIEFATYFEFDESTGEIVEKRTGHRCYYCA